MRDFLRKSIGFLLFAAVVILLSSCATMAGAGKDLKDASKWLPEPYGAIAESAGTVLALFAGHKGVRHIRKRRKIKREARARSTQGHARPGALGSIPPQP
jgi:predicted small secreted protein